MYILLYLLKAINTFKYHIRLEKQTNKYSKS